MKLPRRAETRYFGNKGNYKSYNIKKHFFEIFLWIIPS